MVLGEVKKWLDNLEDNHCVVLLREDVVDSAMSYLESGLDHVRPEYIKGVLDQINSDQYPGFSIWERPDGRFTLSKVKVK